MLAVALLCAGLAASAPAATAPTYPPPPPGTRAYAPENLQSLNTLDQIRVIEKEYADQSGGRQIPDDQLEFYLDQIDSGWGFSRIQQDIATSLRGNGGSWRPDSGWQGRSVICSSQNNRYDECRTNFQFRAVLSQQLSQTRCVEDRNWGQRSGMVWVNGGCRGRFSEDPNGGGRRITCQSNDNRYQECRANFTGRARVFRQLSSTVCTEGRNWGQRPGVLWVNNGCRAEFIDEGVAQTVTCRSDGHYRECRTDFRGLARLARQLSVRACTLGHTWGQRPGLVWVNKGCSGEFVDSDADDYRDNGHGGYSVTCVSNDSRYVTCAWNRSYGEPRLIEQLSGAQCIQGRTWGYDSYRQLWVDRGCRGRFGPR